MFPAGKVITVFSDGREYRYEFNKIKSARDKEDIWYEITTDRRHRVSIVANPTLKEQFPFFPYSLDY